MTSVREARAGRSAKRDRVGHCAAELASARRALEAAHATSANRQNLARLQRRYDEALAAVEKAKAAEHSARARIEGLLGAYRGAPLRTLAGLDANVPIAFFPVRLETRFRRGGPNGAAGELLVRVYPDSILANEHEPLLTAAEVEAGRDYWRRSWTDGDERDAWTLLLKSAAPPRAAWIVAQTSPANPSDRPSSGADPAPVFEGPEIRPDGWHRAPEAKGLPEQWIVTAYRDRQLVHQVFSEPVREGLALTFRLSGEGTGDEELDNYVELTGDGLTVEPEALWAFDFPEAVAAGMAVAIPLDETDLALGFTELVVLGVRASDTPEQQASDLAEALIANNRTRGVAFVPQGAKTNNSADNPSDYPPADPAGAVSFRTYRGPSLAVAGHDGERAMKALGLDPETAAHFWGADRDEQGIAIAMGDCLWPATFGYALREMMAPHGTPSMAEALRAHARDYVRGRGPYPAFRVGPAPYGLLPVSPIAAWPEADREGPERVLRQALQRLYPIWLQASSAVPRIGRSGDPDADLIATLAMDASAQTARIRRAFGYDLTWNLWKLHGLDPARLDEARAGLGDAVLEAIGQPQWNPRVLHLNFASEARDFGGPLIEEGPLSEDRGLAFNYIQWLRTAKLEELRNQAAPPASPPVTALLYLMLRHGMLAELDNAATQVLDWRGLVNLAELRETELLSVVTPAEGKQAASGAWDRLDMKVAGVTRDKSLGDYLSEPRTVSQTLARPVRDAVERMEALRTSLGLLEGLPTAALDRLFTETLDIGSHRLDAWLVSLYTKQLETMRESRPGGILIGAYGWVENLRADPPAPTVTVTAPDGTAKEARPDEGGYVLAPSMLHASAAAVLRSAFLSRSGADRQPYTIDLSSRRVRTALWLIDTVREDQPLGAALGYQFERGLHERHPGVELDQFIDEFRTLYPLVAGKAEDSGDPVESIAARNVVDGLRLHRASAKGEIPFGSGTLTPDDPERAAIDAELKRLDETIDAVSDLLTSESVYQILKGSMAGASASLDSLAKGTRAPEIEVATTPRSGTVLHHRSAILFDAALAPDWSALGSSPRAEAAPELNAWLGSLFGAPGRMACTVHVEGQPDVPVTAADLGLQPIDLFHLVRGVGSIEAGADLNHMVAWHVAGVLGADTPVSIDHEAALDASAASFAQVIELGLAIGRVLGFARPLGPIDLLPPEAERRTAEADPMLAELAARAAGARTALGNAIDALEVSLDAVAAAPAGTDPDLAALRQALRSAWAFGLPGAHPSARHDNSAPVREGLVAAASAALATLRARREAADAAGNPAAILQAIFTQGFLVVGRFVPAAAEILAPALADEPDLGGLFDAEIEGWHAGLGAVREPIGAWRQLLAYERAFARLPDRPRIVQLPLLKTPAVARWAALPDAAGERPRSGLVSLTLSSASVPQANAPWAGLLLDSWPELIPNIEEDAGLAFHHDAPGAQAPQAVLLAVPPPGQTKWSFQLLEQTLFHAQDLARIRCVDLPDLPSVAQLLPTSFLAANPANATIGTSFAGLLRAQAVIREKAPS